MHTIMVIIGGLALLVVMVVLARILGGSPSARAAAGWFILLWLVLALTNMWFGVSRAGYSVMEEAPIFLIVFALPALVALVVRRFV
jgi:hypothetical protein